MATLEPELNLRGDPNVLERLDGEPLEEWGRPERARRDWPGAWSKLRRSGRKAWS